MGQYRFDGSEEPEIKSLEQVILEDREARERLDEPVMSQTAYDEYWSRFNAGEDDPALEASQLEVDRDMSEGRSR